MEFSLGYNQVFLVISPKNANVGNIIANHIAALLAPPATMMWTQFAKSESNKKIWKKITFTLGRHYILFLDDEIE